MTVTHGVNVYAGPTKGQPPIKVDSELTAMVGFFPVDKDTNPTKGKPKEWYECTSWEDYKSAYGFTEFWGTGQLARALFPTPKSVQTLMQTFGVRPVLIYNVFDPTIHITSIANEHVPAFAPGAGQTQELVETPILIDTVVITNTAGAVTYVLGIDYSLERSTSTGKIEVTRIATGAILANETVDADYDYVDGTKVTTAHLTTAIDGVNNIMTELGAGKLPGWVHCPYYSQKSTGATTVPADIRAALLAIAGDLNTVFKTRFVYDIDETDYNTSVAAGTPDLTQIYADVNVRSEYGRVFFGEGAVTGHTEQLLSDWFLGLQSAEVAANGFPGVSPSNRLLENYTPNNKLSFPVPPNAINEHGIITVSLNLADQGWNLWGTKTSYYNGTATDLKKDSTNQDDIIVYLVQLITKDIWIKNTDRNFNKILAGDVVDKWNTFGAQQVSKGKLLGWELVFDPDDNPDLSQYVKFRLYILGPEPMGQTDVEIQVDLNYFETVFG
jgi:hypothetical protein